MTDDARVQQEPHKQEYLTIPWHCTNCSSQFEMPVSSYQAHVTYRCAQCGKWAVLDGHRAVSKLLALVGTLFDQQKEQEHEMADAFRETKRKLDETMREFVTLLQQVEDAKDDSCEFCDRELPTDDATALQVCSACWNRANEGTGWMQRALAVEATLAETTTELAGLGLAYRDQADELKHHIQQNEALDATLATLREHHEQELNLVRDALNTDIKTASSRVLTLELDNQHLQKELATRRDTQTPKGCDLDPLTNVNELGTGNIK